MSHLLLILLFITRILINCRRNLLGYQGTHILYALEMNSFILFPFMLLMIPLIMLRMLFRKIFCNNGFPWIFYLWRNVWCIWGRQTIIIITTINIISPWFEFGTQMRITTGLIIWNKNTIGVVPAPDGTIYLLDINGIR